MNRPVQETSVASACVPNIAGAGQLKRRIKGVVTLLVTFGVFALLASRHASVPAFLLVAPFAGLTALYFLQAKEKT